MEIKDETENMRKEQDITKKKIKNFFEELYSISRNQKYNYKISKT